MCSLGNSLVVNMKTITQSKLLITDWGLDQVIVHLYEYWFMLMLTLFLFLFIFLPRVAEAIPTKNSRQPREKLSATRQESNTQTHTHIRTARLQCNHERMLWKQTKKIGKDPCVLVRLFAKYSSMACWVNTPKCTQSPILIVHSIPVECDYNVCLYGTITGASTSNPSFSGSHKRR